MWLSVDLFVGNQMSTTTKNEHGEQTDLSRRAFKIRETSEMLGVSELTVRRLIKRGELKAIRKLRHVLIPLSEVDRFLDPEK